MTDESWGPASACADLDGFFTVRVRSDGPLHVVVMSGELDLASSAAAIRACTPIDHVDVVVAMADLVFMDCAGYGALVASRAILERRGGSMVLMDPVGEPLRLLTLLQQAADDPGAMLQLGTSSVSLASAERS